MPHTVGALTAACGPSGHGGSGLATDKGAEAGHILAFGGNRTSGPIEVTPALLAQPGSGWKGDFESETFVTQPVAFDPTQITSATNRSNPRPGDPCHTLAKGAHAPAIAFPANLSGTQHASTEELAPSMGAANPTAVAIRTAQTGSNGWGVNTEGTAYTLDSAQKAVAAGTTKLHNTGSNNAGKLFEERTTCLDANSPPPALLTAMQVRRLTPRECERLQGFPDGYTAIPWRNKPASECPDGPRYKALGNSWAVPVVAWIGARIAAELGGRE